MGGDVETIKERLDIAEIVGGHVKLEKSGTSFKGRCPFHNEKTPSFFVSPARQSYYCFGCGAKGDIFTFVQETEGLSFREALKELADRAGVELKGREVSTQEKSEKERLRDALEQATLFFEAKLAEHAEAREYLQTRGLTDESVKKWRIGYAPAEWRALYHHLLSRGFNKETLTKAGLTKPVAGEVKEPYDVFRDRLVFPILDPNGEITGFSGRALAKETEPKYLNTPETALFAKHELLYGLDKAKGDVRKKNYAVLVEGQMDLVLSHQAGVGNTVASSGTAFTAAHLERLKRLSPRIILAFDGDAAGEKAGEKATELALSLGLEVKIAKLPPGSDPADVIKQDPATWKEILRQAKPAIEHLLEKILETEKESRKAGKLIVVKLLPLLALLSSSIERSHFVSLIAKRTGVKEEMIWEDLRKMKAPTPQRVSGQERGAAVIVNEAKGRSERVEERLTEVRTWLKELPEKGKETDALRAEEKELLTHLGQERLREELGTLMVALAGFEASKNEAQVLELSGQIQKVLKEIRALEE